MRRQPLPNAGPGIIAGYRSLDLPQIWCLLYRSATAILQLLYMPVRLRCERLFSGGDCPSRRLHVPNQTTHPPSTFTRMKDQNGHAASNSEGRPTAPTAPPKTVYETIRPKIGRAHV